MPSYKHGGLVTISNQILGRDNTARHQRRKAEKLAKQQLIKQLRKLEQRDAK